MLRKTQLFLLFVTLWLLLFHSCSNSKPETAFYFWKTVFQLDTIEQRALQEIEAKSMYLRIMDIDFDPTGTQAVPISPVTFTQAVPKEQTLIPVVFINQRIFAEMDSLQIRALANKIVPFVEAKVKQAGKTEFRELQLDCDWTRTSRDKFFYLLKYLQALPELDGVSLSSTLRLHQVKNTATSGIPPVKKVTLMCYNMGNLRQFGSQNSILNLQDLQRYLSGSLAQYPMDIDIALPLFQWFVAFRNNNYIGISKYISEQDIQDTTLFTRNPNTNLYILNVDLPKANLRKGDVIRFEKVSKEDLLQTAKFLKGQLKGKKHQIIYYHLDQATLANHGNAELQEITRAF
ncbi:hypothetical protein K7A41_15515 [Sphingobacterium sp. InxBP1]|uniref:hypothetical protein n=1 Tax=Sphingobacterium sp. InxBP1 TaxID=2870328 RepID=UPI002243D773|nr:hypothetical protein [Sphingobacterium sp. InxBP1]MCW8312640.1 hypothetical protein [Sphingobacterium sp. InxBP1]